MQFGFLEIQHPGLTDDEMEELLALLVERDPNLASKYSLASEVVIGSFIEGLHGWPQALVLILAKLSSSLQHFSDFELDGVDEHTYQSLLGEVFGALSVSEQASLLAGGAYPFTFTLAGVSAVLESDEVSVAADLAHLLRIRLIVESAQGQYRFGHPLVAEYVRRKHHSSVGLELRAKRASQYLLEVADINGGQPQEGWSNFLILDREFETSGSWRRSIAVMDQ